MGNAKIHHQLEETILRKLNEDALRTFAQLVMSFDDVDLFVIGQYTYDDLNGTLDSLEKRKMIKKQVNEKGQASYCKIPSVAAKTTKTTSIYPNFLKRLIN